MRIIVETAEVATLMGLLRHYLRAELGTLLKNQIRFRVVGRPEALAPDIREELTRAEAQSANHRGLQLNVALNYGGGAGRVAAAPPLPRPASLLRLSAPSAPGCACRP